MLSLSEIVTQLNLDEDELTETDKTYLSGLSLAVSEAVARDIGRRLYLSQADLDGDMAAPDTALVVNESIKLAMKLLLGHFYANREATTPENLKAIPLGLQYLLDPYRLVEM